MIWAQTVTGSVSGVVTPGDVFEVRDFGSTLITILGVLVGELGQPEGPDAFLAFG